MSTLSTGSRGTSFLWNFCTVLVSSLLLLSTASCTVASVSPATQPPPQSFGEAPSADLANGALPQESAGESAQPPLQPGERLSEIRNRDSANEENFVELAESRLKYRYLIRLTGLSVDHDFDDDFLGENPGEFRVTFVNPGMSRPMNFLQGEFDLIKEVTANRIRDFKAATPRETIRLRNGDSAISSSTADTVFTGIDPASQDALNWRYAPADYDAPYVLIPPTWVMNQAIHFQVQLQEYNDKAFDWAVKGTPLVLDLAGIDFDQLVEQVHIVKTIRMNRRGIYFASLEFEVIRLNAEEAEQVSAKHPEDFIDDTMGLHHSDERTDDGGTKGTIGRPANPGEDPWNYGPRGIGENDYRVPEIHAPWATGPVVKPPKRPPWFI